MPETGQDWKQEISAIGQARLARARIHNEIGQQVFRHLENTETKNTSDIAGVYVAFLTGAALSW